MRRRRLSVKIVSCFWILIILLRVFGLGSRRCLLILRCRVRLWMLVSLIVLIVPGLLFLVCGRCWVICLVKCRIGLRWLLLRSRCVLL